MPSAGTESIATPAAPRPWSSRIWMSTPPKEWPMRIGGPVEPADDALVVLDGRGHRQRLDRRGIGAQRLDLDLQAGVGRREHAVAALREVLRPSAPSSAGSSTVRGSARSCRERSDPTARVKPRDWSRCSCSACRPWRSPPARRARSSRGPNLAPQPLDNFGRSVNAHTAALSVRERSEEMLKIRTDDEIYEIEGGWFHARWHFSFDRTGTPSTHSSEASACSTTTG